MKGTNNIITFPKSVTGDIGIWEISNEGAITYTKGGKEIFYIEQGMLINKERIAMFSLMEEVIYCEFICVYFEACRIAELEEVTVRL